MDHRRFRDLSVLGSYSSASVEDEPGSVRQSVFDCEDDIHEFLRKATIPHRVIDHLYDDRPDVSG